MSHEWILGNCPRLGDRPARWCSKKDQTDSLSHRPAGGLDSVKCWLVFVDYIRLWVFGLSRVTVLWLSCGVYRDLHLQATSISQLDDRGQGIVFSLPNVCSISEVSKINQIIQLNLWYITRKRLKDCWTEKRPKLWNVFLSGCFFTCLYEFIFMSIRGESMPFDKRNYILVDKFLCNKAI